MDLPQVQPVFINAKDIINFKTVQEYEICESVTKVISRDKLIATQRVRMLWRIYVKDNEARINLCTSHLNIRGQTVQVFSNNPFRAGIDTDQTDDDVIRIVIKEVPLSKGNRDIENYLTLKDIKLKRPIEFGKVRNDHNELTNFLNGDRIVYVEPFRNPLPRRAQIGGGSAVIFHRGQKKWQKPLCNNCFQEGHFRNQCQNEPCCMVCKKPGHSPGEPICPGSAKQLHKNVEPFQGYESPLSNYYPCDFKVFGVEVKSAEHGYQFSKAVQCGHEDIANQVLSAKTALNARRIASSLPFNPNWESVKEGQMAQVLEAKAKQCQEFCDMLKESGTKILAEAVPGDFFWSAGLNKCDILKVKKNSWPGQNRMGKLLMDIRAKVAKEKPQKSSQRRKNQGKTTSSQTNDRSESESDYYFSD